jgi:hypothetical protein
VNALEYLQLVELSEPGAFFLSAGGLATFRSRTDLQAASESGVVFGAGGIPMADLAVVYGTEEMTNTVAVTWSAGTVVGGTAVASNAASQAAYGVIDATYATLLASDADAQLLADWVVAQYQQPAFRFDTVTVRLQALTAAQQSQVLGLELGSVAYIDWTPSGVGASVAQYVVIDGISHAATPAIHDVTFTLSQTMAAFVLDSTPFGQLDDDHLGF